MIPYSNQSGNTVRLDLRGDTARPQWWLSEDEQRYQDVLASYKYVRDTDAARLECNRHHSRLYGGDGWDSIGKSLIESITDPNRMQLNVIKASIDSFVAKIGTQRAAPKPMTQGGNPSLRRKAKLLERFLLAQFRISGVYQEATKVVLDACVFGTGIFKCYREEDKICVERCHPSEVFVDPLEALYGEPRTIYQRRWVAKDVLLSMAEDYGASEETLVAISAAGKTDLAQDDDRLDLPYDARGDQILVLEAWRLPSKKGAKDGKHAMVVDTAEVYCEPWKHDFLPFVFLRWTESLNGFWGRGVAEELNGIQSEINRLLGKIQSIFHLLAVPRIFYNTGARFQKPHFDNKIGCFVPYTGQPPIIATAQTVHPEVFQHLDRLWSRAFDIVGVPQLGNRAQNPLQGDVSGVAISTWHDVESERFKDKAQKLEEALLSLSYIQIAFAKDIGGNYAAPSQKDRNTIDWIKWKDIDMKEDQYILQIFPVSNLPSTPAGRLQAVIQMVNAQLIPMDTAKRLLDFPDLEAEMSLDRAASDLIDAVIEQILDDGEYLPPEPFMDLELALKKAQLWYNKASMMSMGSERDEEWEDRLELLRRFMTQTRKLLQAAMVEQQKLAAEVAGMNQPVDTAAPPAPGPNGQRPTAVTQQDGALSGF